MRDEGGERRGGREEDVDRGLYFPHKRRAEVKQRSDWSEEDRGERVVMMRCRRLLRRAVWVLASCRLPLPQSHAHDSAAAPLQGPQDLRRPPRPPPRSPRDDSPAQDRLHCLLWGPPWRMLLLAHQGSHFLLPHLPLFPSTTRLPPLCKTSAITTTSRHRFGHHTWLGGGAEDERREEMVAAAATVVAMEEGEVGWVGKEK
eukprot:167535-Hanusia_phi.AAC.1